VISKENNSLAGENSKHTWLNRPSLGNFGRNEWAFLGAPCINIKLLADTIINALSPTYKCAYADTSHNDEVTLPPGRIASGAVLEYTDQLNYQQFNYSSALSPVKFRQQFNETDLVLVNGNHQQAKAQVVIIYENKKASLQKRIEQLTNVQLILLDDRVEDVFDFIKEAIPGWQTLPLYSLSDTEGIIAFFAAQIQQAKPVLNGLVLAGGKSVRMGFDKGAINLYGKEQRYYVADMLKNYCNEVFISCREDQKGEVNSSYEVITDTFTGLGPFGAILSAFREDPDKAFLVVACDLPLLDSNTLQYLIENRNVSTIATAYESGFDGLPEPLITIWEPKSYPVLLSFLSQGYSCPRKVLINSNITLLKAPYPQALTNVNTPEDMEKIKMELHQKITAS
jgi:molybdopterin-guanine dinucleotide biosynthesis protein A